jgi:hypothetical protein
MDLDASIIIDDLFISFDEIDNYKDSTTNTITSNNDICLKTLDYMLF